MLQCARDREIRLFGIALTGRCGLPVAVFESAVDGDFLTLPVSPFDAEALIREFTDAGEGDNAVAWLGELIKNRPPLRGRLELDEEETVRICFSFSSRRSRGERKLRLGAGFALSKRLGIPLFADSHLFFDFRTELTWLTDKNAFIGDFLYLTTPEYPLNIPRV